MSTLTTPKSMTNLKASMLSLQIGVCFNVTVECLCVRAGTVCKKHGKMLGFLRTFIKSRPSKQKLKQRGILRERVFGCDLGEHLLNSGLDGEAHAQNHKQLSCLRFGNEGRFFCAIGA